VKREDSIVEPLPNIMARSWGWGCAVCGAIWWGLCGYPWEWIEEHRRCG